jgi:hypothetical protein
MPTLIPAPRIPATVAQEHFAVRAGVFSAAIDIERVGRGPEPLFVDQHFLTSDFPVSRVRKGYLHRVGELLIVVKKELATGCRDGRWKCFDAQPPQRVVTFVDAIVSKIAAAEVVPPMPIVMKTILLERHPLCGANPIIIRNARRGRTWLQAADVFPHLPVPAFGNQYVANHAVVQHFYGLRDGRIGARLRPVSYDFAMGSRGGKEQLAFLHVVGTRFFDIHVLIGRKSQQGNRHMPMVRRRDRYCIYRRIVEDSSEIGDAVGTTGIAHRFR